jgi:ribosomal protein S1
MVKVLGVDRERKRISLSMKDKTVQPEGDAE